MAEWRRNGLGLSQVWEGLWVGPARAVTAESLTSYGITSLVWATPEIPPPTPLPAEVSIVYVDIKDEASQNLTPYFPVVARIYRERRGGVCMVCRAGISRSASLACAALVAHPDLNLTLRAAYTAIRNARPIVRPNYGFFAQLIAYEVEVRGQASARMEPSPYEPGGDLVPDLYLEHLREDLRGSTFTNFFPL